jgi:hypothetical protein
LGYIFGKGFKLLLYHSCVIAKAISDEIHPSLLNSLDHHNTYTLGQISAHNIIIIACLPSDMYATISAVTMATLMRSSFTLIRCSLMIGIEGGALVAAEGCA